jgi:LmbE family N-acetylglucosaminyl deacetylase
VLSLGASIAGSTRSGRRVGVLTVFAGRPDSTVPAGGWDRRGGFSTEGEAVTARRAEDVDACAVIGAAPTWLSLPEADYASERDAHLVWSAIEQAIGDAAAVLVPGFPLTNDDHAWLSRLMLQETLRCEWVGLYVEQPYRYTARASNRRLDAPAFVRDTPLAWTHPAAGPLDRRRKRRAILAYRSQMPLLGFAQHRRRKLNRMLRHELLHRGEAIAWLPRRWDR